VADILKISLSDSRVMSLLYRCQAFTGFTLLLVALAGGITPVFLHAYKVNRKIVAACNALAGGVLLAAALVHILPDASKSLQGLGRDLQRLQDPDTDDAFPIAPVVAAFAFLLLAVLESHMDAGDGGNNHSFHVNPVMDVIDVDPEMGGTACKPKSFVWNLAPVLQLPTSTREVFLGSEHITTRWSKPPSKHGSAYSLVLALAVHSFIEGMSLGAQGHLSSFVGIAVAITAHKGLAGFALGSNMMASCSNSVLYVGVSIFALCSPIGMFVGSEATRFLSASGVGLLLAAASGTFLYVAVPDLILPALHSHGCAVVYLSTFVGMLGMSVLAFWV